MRLIEGEATNPLVIIETMVPRKLLAGYAKGHGNMGIEILEQISASIEEAARKVAKEDREV